MRRLRGDDGNALVEFTYLGVLLMVPLVYGLVMVFLVQRASFAVTEAARQAGRAYATADSVAAGQQRAAFAARLALSDQGIDCDACLSRMSQPLAPGAAVEARVAYTVQLPVLGAFFPDRRAGIRVSAVHVAYVDEFKAP